MTWRRPGSGQRSLSSAVAEATPWLVDLPDPTGLVLSSSVDQPAREHTPTEPPAALEDQLAWLYADLIELWRNTPQLAALAMNDAALERPHRETAPAADLGNRVCDGWEQVIEDCSDEQLTAIDAAVGELGLDGTLIPEDCA